MDEKPKNAPAPVLRASKPSPVAGLSPQESSGITARDYRQAKACAILLPIVIVVGSVTALVIGMSDMDNVRGWSEVAQKCMFGLTVLTSGYLATRATHLRMKPYRDYKREVDLAEYRRRNRLL